MAVRRVAPNLPLSDDSAAFLTDVLGLRQVMDLGWVQTFAADGGWQIQLIGDDETAPVRADISVEVDDVDAVHAACVERGLEIVHPLSDEAWGVRRFFVHEPGGRVLNVLTHGS